MSNGMRGYGGGAMFGVGASTGFGQQNNNQGNFGDNIISQYLAQQTDPMEAYKAKLLESLKGKGAPEITQSPWQQKWFGNKHQTGLLTGGMGLLSGAFGIYNGLQSQKMARKQFDMSKAHANRTLANQAQLTNNQIRGNQNTLNASRGIFGEQRKKLADEYVAKYGVNGSAIK